jgi:hypothetical protein
MKSALMWFLASVAGIVTTCGRCEKGHQTILQTLPDPTGKWIAIVDQVDYVNGLLTSVADRVRVVEAASANSEGALAFSEDALPGGETPTVSWSSGRLLISVSPNANINFRAPHAGGIEISIHTR